MEYLSELLHGHQISGATAEIGTFDGEGSTRILAQYALQQGCDFTAIDIFPDDDVYWKVCEQLANPGCHAVKGPSVAVGQAWQANNKLNFLFIDGDHGFPHLTPEGDQSGIILDILAWHPHLNPGAILAFHDYTGSKSHYGRISLLAVEHAVDCLCHPPAYELIGRRNEIVAFRKTGERVLNPYLRLKQPIQPYAESWKALDSLKAMPPLVIYGTGGGAKYVLDSVLDHLPDPPQVVFTDSWSQSTGTIFGRYPFIPKDEALKMDGLVVNGSLLEAEISEILEHSGKIHRQSYFNHFEFIGWCHVGRFAGSP